MDFTLSDEQQALVDSVRRFREREYDFEARRAVTRSPDGMDGAHWATFAELGWLGAGLAEEAGGYGGSAIETALVCEEFGRGLIVEPFVGHVVALEALATAAPEPRADRIAAMIAGTERLALAHFEAGGRGDAHHVETRAEPHGNGVRLTGAKALVAGGAQADGFLVSARDRNGISLFLVPGDAPGLTVRRYRTLDNHRVADLAIDGVELDGGAVVGGRGAAMPAIERALDVGTVAVCAEAVGAMDAALRLTRDYLRTRRQFGAAIGSFQALQHRMADMLIETELSRSIVHHALAVLAQDDPRARAMGVSAAKVRIGEAVAIVGGQAIQLHGGIGVTEEAAIGHYYRRLFVIARTFGTADIHLERYCALAFGRVDDGAAASVATGRSHAPIR